MLKEVKYNNSKFALADNLFEIESIKSVTTCDLKNVKCDYYNCILYFSI